MKLKIKKNKKNYLLMINKIMKNQKKIYKMIVL